jgi:CRP-like cAMP-binding protein
LDLLQEDGETNSSKNMTKAWEQIFEFAKRKTYKKNEVIVTQGELIKRIYQIGNGSCRVELPGGNKENIVLW